jgi:hypothetical protein
MAGRSMLMERAAANECFFVSPLLERFLTGVLKIQSRLSNGFYTDAASIGATNWGSRGYWRKI